MDYLNVLGEKMWIKQFMWVKQEMLDGVDGDQ